MIAHLRNLSKVGTTFGPSSSFSLVSLLSRSKLARTMASSRPLFPTVELAPPDPILGLNEAFLADTSANKVNLGVGAYRDDNGKPHVLDSVRKAEEIILAKHLNKEYLPISGLADFIKHSLVFAYGESSQPLVEKRVAAIQSLSGTGAVRVAAEFINRFKLATNNTVYQPNPTWGNHVPVFKDAGMKVEQYPYYDRATNTLDMKGWLSKIESAPNGSAFLVHACAHNPTGLDPTAEQWQQLADAFKEKDHFVIVDCAYQGFASGDAEKDAFAIRMFCEQGVKMCLAQSYAKNFGLYGERVGCFSVVCGDSEEKERVVSQLKKLVRPIYSNPPINGARIVATILEDEALRKQWTAECKEMADRILSMRAALVKELKASGSPKDWGHVTQQIGMFCFTGLDEKQVQRMREEFHIYMTKDGRISMAGVTSKNVKYLANSLHEVTKQNNKL